MGEQADSRLKVVIVGGGPAGTACALKLRRLAHKSGREVQVTLIEGKDFQGERHYNQCVGVLSPPLPELLPNELGVPFPGHLVRAHITGYHLHTREEEISLDDEHPCVALRRVQYDAHMLQVAQEHGVKVVNARVIDLEFHNESVLVYSENEPVEGDVVVGAFGLDEGGAALFSRSTGYRPPKSLSSVVTKYHPGDQAMASFGESIHAFLPRDPRIEFAGITPKGNHLTINIAGQHVDSTLMDEFIRRPDVASCLPNLDSAGALDPADLRYFKGRFPRSIAHRYYGDRYVMIGDASGLVRSFKGKGITSAVQTGIRAAETIIRYGYSEAAFRNHFRGENQALLSDLPYGQLMRLITVWLSRTGLLDAVIRAGEGEPLVRGALMGAVSGVVPYREVLLSMLRPRSLRALITRIPR